ncbi:uroporphyrinogen-III synthase [Paenibacillaceae bacterium]|nr:uroporphyrinogen-III synthase [Paenibacillaceae bacterium]
MAGALEGKSIVITGSRKLTELSTIIEKQGGTALVRSQQGTMLPEEETLGRDLQQLVDNRPNWFLFTTGTGLEQMLQQAERMGIREQLIDAISNAKVAARGYKTFALLKKIQISPIAVDDDGTTAGLIRALQDYDYAGQSIVVQQHGEAMPGLVQFLEGKGATTSTILPYRHIPPEADVSETLYQEIIAGRVDAVCFTTAVQVRYFFEYATRKGGCEQIVRSFEDRVAATAVGRVTAEALREAGVKRVIMPEIERMGAMIIELAQFYQTVRNEAL